LFLKETRFGAISQKKVALKTVCYELEMEGKNGQKCHFNTWRSMGLGEYLARIFS
jgi:hypothetical protein